MKHLMLSLVLLLFFLKNKFFLLDQKIFSISSWWCANSCFAQGTGVESMFEKCKHTHVVACMAQEDWRFSLMPLQVWIVLNCQATVCQTTPVRNNFVVLSLSPSLLPPLSPYVWGELHVFVEWAGYNFYAIGLQCNENEIINMLTFQRFLSKSNIY